jgi:signal transduction histidine kinase/DNA-binding NarL/FixJ family response regulator
MAGNSDGGAGLLPAPRQDVERSGLTLPVSITRLIDPPIGSFIAMLAVMVGINAAVLYAIFLALFDRSPAERATVASMLWAAFAVLAAVLAVAAWWLMRTRDSRRAAEIEAAERTGLLLAEVVAHRDTDTALQRAKEVAEAANLAKSRYLVGVSHEIRSPLNAIYGYAQLLERGAGIAPQDAGGVIRRASEHLTNIVDGLLDISRIESGVLKLSRDVVPLPAFLESIVEMFRVQAANKGLQFHYDPAPNLPAFVRTDEKRLRQILINLLSNAIKYTPTGSARLTVRYRGLIAEFDVCDTGIGIPAADIDRIFEPFERGSAEVARAQPGTGLGLAITRVLAQVMGGDVAVTSTPGEGSVFKLRLMLAEPGDAVAATARQRQITGYTGRRRTILLIDDDPLQLAVLQSLLRPLGFSVYAASNGPDGLELALNCAPDLVLLDIQMPGLSGWDVAPRLRSIAATGPSHDTNIKILLVSANAHEFAAGGDGAAAQDGFVAKPVDLQSLLDTIAGQLGLEWISDAAVGGDASLPASVLTAPAARIVELRRLGQAGHIRGIEAALTALADEVPASRPLVEQLHGYVRAFDLAGYLRLLDAHG